MAACEVIVAGLGAMGSATAYHLARRGVRVLGFDRFAPSHAFGSSHGESRIIREAYFEHPLYVPFVRRAFELWQELAQESGDELLLQTGGLMVGPPEGALVSGALCSARTHGLKYEILSPAALSREYPAFHLDENTIAVHEPRAGVLFPEKCIAAHLQAARKYGAELHCEEAVLSWRQEGAGVEVVTARAKYRAARLVLAAGPWLPDMLRELALPLRCTRQAVFWFHPTARRENFTPRRFPIFIFEHQAGRYFYGFPDLGRGAKIAIHHEGETTTPETMARAAWLHEERQVATLLEKYLPDAAGKAHRSAVCIYTNTPDGHFLIDFHPAASQVLLVSPCSGHGFKFSCAIGEWIAQWVLAEQQRFDFSPFRLQRFTASDSRAQQAPANDC